MKSSLTEPSTHTHTHVDLPGLPSPQTIWMALGVVIALALSVITYQVSDLQFLLLLWIGLLFGYTLFHARFGFTSAFRRFMAVGNGEALRAHMIMLAIATTLFAPILASGLSFFGEATSGYVSPVGVSVLFGAFLFGIGMQLGGG